MTGMLQEVYQRGSCPAYRCRECGSQLGRGQAKAGRHLCVTPQGTASCVTLCPQGRRLNKSHMRFYLDPEAQGYVCTLCDTEFLSSRPYHKHMRHIHGQETGSQFPCPTCDRFFETALKLWRHKVAVHQAKTLVCDVCGKTCDNQLSFTDHKRQHRLGKYQCEHCPKTFARKHTWVYHTRRHTGHSLHKCQHCGKALMGNYNLRIHERIHTGEKPYKCDQCFAAFAQKNSLNWHMKKHSFAFN
ncbi:gastrula zinc finger protein XlCGF52.1-like [Littorina saxatilis]|uniref:gastrula zinc finger protein XlCGF52.1-like n=1 Tax=Littorina saxatilis TaxID=31220 RepID=UPI0038B574DF